MNFKELRYHGWITTLTSPSQLENKLIRQWTTVRLVSVSGQVNVCHRSRGAGRFDSASPSSAFSYRTNHITPHPYRHVQFDLPLVIRRLLSRLARPRCLTCYSPKTLPSALDPLLHHHTLI